jgi:predicted Ser/Thr protein kinase
MYRSKWWTNNVALWLFFALLSVPVLAIVYVLLFFLVPAMVLTATFGVCALVGFYLSLGGWLGQSKLRFGADGIVFPYCFLQSLSFQLERDWDEIKVLIFMHENVPSETPSKIKLDFKDGSYASLNIDGMTRSDLELLFLALDTYNPKLKKYPSPERVNLNIAWSSGDGKRLGYTDLWNHSLTSRFGSTAFVPLQCGDSLQDGRITIVGQKGFGGLSAVYLAKLDNGDYVALKECVPLETHDQEALEKSRDMFVREARILASLDHPRIAKVLDHFVENGRHYLVLEHIPGKNLRSLVADEGPQPEATVKTWALEAAAITAYLHGLEPPVIHRDITPDNLILGNDGSLFLIDFGAANTFLGTATGTVVGKASYIPLEQFRGKACPQSDLFALAATCYFLLTGKDPKPLTECDPSCEGIRISEAFNDAIVQCTRTEYKERPANVAALVELLSRKPVTANQNEAILAATENAILAGEVDRPADGDNGL